MANEQRTEDGGADLSEFLAWFNDAWPGVLGTRDEVIRRILAPPRGGGSTIFRWINAISMSPAWQSVPESLVVNLRQGAALLSGRREAQRRSGSHVCSSQGEKQ